jgi:hypothetical protein
MPPVRLRNDRLCEELQTDVAGTRADCHTNADLTRTLRHRHQHDIHDADPADHQGDPCDAGQQQGHDPKNLAGSGRNVGHVLNPEIVRFSFRNTMSLPQQFGNLRFGEGRATLAGGRNHGLAYRKDGALLQLLLHRGVGNYGDIILIIPKGASLCLENAHHL